MADDPYYFMKFEVVKWQRDLDEHPLEIEGAWIRICCKLWWASKRGELTLRPERWAVILRANINNANRIIDYLLDEHIADGKREANGYITLISRKMIRENKDRELNRLRQQKYYHKNKSNADITGSQQDFNKQSKSKSKSKKEIKKGDRASFIIPTIEEITIFCKERNNNVSSQTFIDHYTSNGWMVGKNKMKDWKAAVRTWEKRNFESGNGDKQQVPITKPKEYTGESMPELSDAKRIDNMKRVKELISTIG